MHRIKHFNIIHTSDGYIVHNTKHPFNKSHTHIKSFNYCKRLVYNVLYNRRPKTKNLYLLESHCRISDNESYITLIEQLKESRSRNKEQYINVQKGVKR